MLVAELYKRLIRQMQTRTFGLPMLLLQRKGRTETVVVVVLAFVVLKGFDPEEVTRVKVAVCLILYVQDWPLAEELLEFGCSTIGVDESVSLDQYTSEIRLCKVFTGQLLSFPVAVVPFAGCCDPKGKYFVWRDRFQIDGDRLSVSCLIISP